MILSGVFIAHKTGPSRMRGRHGKEVMSMEAQIWNASGNQSRSG